MTTKHTPRLSNAQLRRFAKKLNLFTAEKIHKWGRSALLEVMRTFGTRKQERLATLDGRDLRAGLSKVTQ